MVILFTKVKPIKEKNLLKVREPTVANTDDTLVYLTPSLSKWLPDGVRQKVKLLKLKSLFIERVQGMKFI